MKEFKKEIQEVKDYLFKAYNKVIKPLLIILVLFLVGLFCVSFFSGCSKIRWSDIPQDSPLEELTEEIIKQKYGIDIDLSYNSPEEINP